jgi:SOS response regulatory protein OraA/RecX
MKKGPGNDWGMERRLQKVLRDVEAIREQWRREQKRAKTEQEFTTKISEATKAGMERARARGVKFGGARKRKPKVSIKQVRQLRRKGFTQEQIADALHVSQAHVSNLLQRRKK